MAISKIGSNSIANEDLTITSGNFVIGTGGKGLDFSAQTAASAASSSATGALFD